MIRRASECIMTTISCLEDNDNDDSDNDLMHDNDFDS